MTACTFRTELLKCLVCVIQIILMIVIPPFFFPWGWGWVGWWGADALSVRRDGEYCEWSVGCSPREPHALAWAPVASIQKSFGSSGRNCSKPWKNYWFLVNFAPTDSLDIPLLAMVRFASICSWQIQEILALLRGWVGLWGFLWWAPSAKRKDHHGVSSGCSSVWDCSNTGLSSSQYGKIPIILGVWPFWLTPFFILSITIWRAYG